MTTVQWPLPPINFDDFNSPDFIPSKITIFNNIHLFDGRNIKLETAEQPVDLDLVAEKVEESIRNFKELIKSFNPKYLDNIVKVHTEINEILNKGKIYEKDEGIKMGINKQEEVKREIYNKL
ncbi:hypothetical protein NUSPORA_02481 [Nucleospora cyclopteri]